MISNIKHFPSQTRCTSSKVTRSQLNYEIPLKANSSDFDRSQNIQLKKNFHVNDFLNTSSSNISVEHVVEVSVNDRSNNDHSNENINGTVSKNIICNDNINSTVSKNFITCKPKLKENNCINESSTSNHPIDNLSATLEDDTVTRPSSLYFNPSRLNDDYQYSMNNTCEYYTNDEFNQAFTASNNRFSILNLNIHSMSKNLDKLREYLDMTNHKFSVIAIQETWFKADTSLDYFNLPDYNLETINRIDSYVGGVGLYISNDIEYSLRNDLNSQNQIFESCFIEINRSNHKNIIIGTLYRHHHHSINTFNNQLDDIIKKIVLENKLIYLVGDFNVNILKDNENYIKDFIDMMYSYSLNPLILRPTRITNKSETLIDNIFTNDLISNTGGILIQDTSDHLPNFSIAETKLNLKENKFHEKKVRNFSNINVSKLKTCMANHNWENCFKMHNDVNDA